MDNDPNLKEEMEQDVSSECGKMGKVERVRVYHNHKEGVVSVRFKEPEGAIACIEAMHGRFFGGRQISAEAYDGFTNFNVKRAKETEAEQAARLERYAAELESQG
mmetsp:Transcript_30430/g.97244  ORF Transcript_30430/g.97244 Transcript_30430/m.97244 type:complete len:105 (+) Transcript_30430:89-403(+)